MELDLDIQQKILSKFMFFAKFFNFVRSGPSPTIFNFQLEISCKFFSIFLTIGQLSFE